MTSRFVWKQGDIVLSQCNFCKHRGIRANCTAFPERIPKAIRTNQHDHRKPYPSDNGIRFEPVDDEAAEIVARMFDDDDVEAR